MTSILNSGENVAYYISGWLDAFRKGTNFSLKSDMSNINILNLIKENVVNVDKQKKIMLRIKNKQVSLKFFSKEISVCCKQNAEYVESVVKGGKLNTNVYMYYIGMLEALASKLHNDTLLFDSKIHKVKNILVNLGLNSELFNEEFICLNKENTLQLLYVLFEDVGVLQDSSLYNYFCSLKKKYYDCVEIKHSNSSNNEMKKSHFTDAGTDVYCNAVDSVVGDVIMLNTTISMVIPVGYWGMLCPRSSIIKTGFYMSNSFGVIDSSYRGEIKVSLTHKKGVDAGLILLKEMLPFKFAQLIFIRQVMPEFISVEPSDIQPDTLRGAGGHGSTTIKQFPFDKEIQHTTEELQETMQEEQLQMYKYMKSITDNILKKNHTGNN